MPIAVIPMAPLVRKNVRSPCLTVWSAGHRLLTLDARPYTVGKGLRSGIGLFARRDQFSFSLQVVASFWREEPGDQEQNRQIHLFLVRRAMKCSPIVKLIFISAMTSSLMFRSSDSVLRVTYPVGAIHVVSLSAPILGVRLGLPCSETERINPTANQFPNPLPPSSNSNHS